jgi:aminopeptidase-like protein
MLWALNQADGTRSLLDVAARSGIAFGDLERVSRRLVDAGLLEATGWTIP